MQIKSLTSKDTIDYKLTGFDSDKYRKVQSSKILERIDKFRGGKLYLEIGGKFLFDPHAARVLPGFDPYVKKSIFLSMRNIIDIFFCINAQDIIADRQLSSSRSEYTTTAKIMIHEIEQQLLVKPKIIINLNQPGEVTKVDEYRKELDALGYETYKRYRIEGYPEQPEKILSASGYGADDYIPTKKNLILVVGAASSSGKMSTCLGQIYLDQLRGIDSGYAKYETFPIWSLPISHPVNLAYEAATVDIGDFNVIDKYHEAAYDKRAVNYNRDVEAFEILRKISIHHLPESNFMREYLSPTDMGISNGGSAITNDHIVCIASLHEIKRRRDWIIQQMIQDTGYESWIKKCDNLYNQALKYIDERGYDPNVPIS